MTNLTLWGYGLQSPLNHPMHHSNKVSNPDLETVFSLNNNEYLNTEIILTEIFPLVHETWYLKVLMMNYLSIISIDLKLFEFS